MEYVNDYTGEVYDPAQEEGLRKAYDKMKEMKAKLKKMEEAVKVGMKKMLAGQESRKIINQIYELKAVKSVRRSYSVSVLKKYFDEDQFIECVKPINKQVDEMLKILNPDARLAIEGSMQVVGESVTYKIV